MKPRKKLLKPMTFEVSNELRKQLLYQIRKLALFGSDKSVSQKKNSQELNKLIKKTDVLKIRKRNDVGEIIEERTVENQYKDSIKEKKIYPKKKNNRRKFGHIELEYGERYIKVYKDKSLIDFISYENTGKISRYETLSRLSSDKKKEILAREKKKRQSRVSKRDTNKVEFDYMEMNASGTNINVYKNDRLVQSIRQNDFKKVEDLVPVKSKRNRT